MAAEYKLILREWSTGSKVAEISDFWDLRFIRRIGVPGLFEFSLSGTNSKLGLMTYKTIIEIHRRNPDLGLDWYTEFTGFILDKVYRFNTHSIVTIKGYSDAWLLEGREIVWPAGLTNRTTFSATSAETIMRTLFTYNITSQATVANGRWADGSITGMSLGTNKGTSQTVDEWNCHGKNLLSELQALAKISGGDFNLNKTGPKTWQFEWYLGQIGTDRSTSVLFSLDRYNMANVTYTVPRSTEKTMIIAAGVGEGSNRLHTTQTGPNWSSDNSIERYYDGRNEKELDGLNEKAKAQAQTYKSKPTLDFDVIQVHTSYYGLHYFLGDICKAKYEDFDGNVKILSVSAQLRENGQETIAIETEAV